MTTPESAHTTMTRLNSLTPGQWQQVYAIRAEYLRHGLSTEPADRPAAEHAITAVRRTRRIQWSGPG